MAPVSHVRECDHELVEEQRQKLHACTARTPQEAGALASQESWNTGVERKSRRGEAMTLTSLGDTLQPVLNQRIQRGIRLDDNVGQINKGTRQPAGTYL